jgi:D-glycero-D-manno-heptose 1,7-bisphosphate phosphatase
MTARAVFLDRDGVLNRALIRNGKPYPPSSLAEFEVLPGVPEALLRLRQAGFRLIVVTNQPDVARGTTSRKAVDELNQLLRSRTAVDDIRVCFHDEQDNCACRKPKPGLLVEAARQHGIDLHASWMVGDRWRDIAAGQAAGCRTVFIDHGYDEKRPHPPASLTVTDLPNAADSILKETLPQR